MTSKDGDGGVSLKRNDKGNCIAIRDIILERHPDQ